MTKENSHKTTEIQINSGIYFLNLPNGKVSTDSVMKHDIIITSYTNGRPIFTFSKRLKRWTAHKQSYDPVNYISLKLH